MLKKILVVLAIAIAVLLIFASRQPDTFHVERSITIDAPSTAIFPHVNTLKAWNAWSPWFALDPQMTQTYAGPDAGVGATTHWAGNSDVGEGRMTITESATNEHIAIKLEFLKPFEATSAATFSFESEGAQTKLTWSMDGENNFLSKLFCLFMDMDQMVGGDFETGLATLKAITEADLRPSTTSLKI